MTCDKAMVQVRYTYDVIFGDEQGDENGEIHDVSERGWYVPNTGKFPVEDQSASEYVTLTPREAIEQIGEIVGSVDSISGGGETVSVYPADSEPDYHTGDETMYHAHLVGDPRVIRVICKRLER